MNGREDKPKKGFSENTIDMIWSIVIIVTMMGFLILSSFLLV